mgnify:CR=1 FL=1
MSQYFPKYRDKAGYPLDFETINANFRQVVNEIEGNLGEHNWAENAITAVTDVNEAAALRIYTTSAKVDHGMDYNNDVNSSPTNYVQISNSREWTVLVENTISTDASMVWVMGSFQNFYMGLTPVEAGFQYCIALNGNPVAETIAGCMDRSNDITGEGMYANSSGFVLDAVIPVLPGQKTFSIRGRLIADEDLTTFASTTKACQVFNRELILVEMR